MGGLPEIPEYETSQTDSLKIKLSCSVSLQKSNNLSTKEISSIKLSEMKKISVFLIAMMLFPFVFAQHLINDAAYRQKVHHQFLKRQTEMSSGGNKPFSIFQLPLSSEQREAMEFLYAYMPLNDIADYDGAFFLNQVNASLEAKKTFSWGKTFPMTYSATLSSLTG